MCVLPACILPALYSITERDMNNQNYLGRLQHAVLGLDSGET